MLGQLAVYVLAGALAAGAIGAGVYALAVDDDRPQVGDIQGRPSDADEDDGTATEPDDGTDEVTDDAGPDGTVPPTEPAETRGTADITDDTDDT